MPESHDNNVILCKLCTHTQAIYKKQNHVSCLGCNGEYSFLCKLRKIINFMFRRKKVEKFDEKGNRNLIALRCIGYRIHLHIPTSTSRHTLFHFGPSIRFVFHLLKTKNYPSMGSIKMYRTLR